MSRSRDRAWSLRYEVGHKEVFGRNKLVSLPHPPCRPDSLGLLPFLVDQKGQKSVMAMEFQAASARVLKNIPIAEFPMTLGKLAGSGVMQHKGVILMTLVYYFKTDNKFIALRLDLIPLDWTLPVAYHIISDKYL